MVDVTLIVPVYGVEKYIERCARSIFAQTYAHFEVIFVNDCTRDRSEEILLQVIAEYAQSSISAHLIRHEVNRGISAARETGLNAASGDYILYVDSDDFIADDMVAQLLAAARQDDADIVVCDYYEVKQGRHTPVSQAISPMTPQAFLTAMLSQQRDWTPWNKLFRRSLATKNNIHWPVGINMAEDLLVMVKLFSFAERLTYVPRPLYYYNRDNINSLVSTISARACKQSAEAISQVVDFIQQRGRGELLIHAMQPVKLMLRFNMLYTQDPELLDILRTLYPETNKQILGYAHAGLPWKLLLLFWVDGHTRAYKSMLFLISCKKQLKQLFSGN